MTTALASLLSGRPVRSDVAMTGEVSLTGRVLPIGGVKQKLLAAHRAGYQVLIPPRNEPDLDDVPAEVLAKLTVHPVSDVREVLALALEPAGSRGRRDRSPPERADARARLRKSRPGRQRAAARPPTIARATGDGSEPSRLKPSATCDAGLGHHPRAVPRCGQVAVCTMNGWHRYTSPAGRWP